MKKSPIETVLGILVILVAVFLFISPRTKLTRARSRDMN